MAAALRPAPVVTPFVYQPRGYAQAESPDSVQRSPGFQLYPSLQSASDDEEEDAEEEAEEEAEEQAEAADEAPPPTAVYTPRGHAAVPDALADTDGAPGGFMAENYPSLAPSAAAEPEVHAPSEDQPAPAAAFQYAPRGHARATAVSSSCGSGDAPSFPAERYPSVAPSPAEPEPRRAPAVGDAARGPPTADVASIRLRGLGGRRFSVSGLRFWLRPGWYRPPSRANKAARST